MTGILIVEDQPLVRGVVSEFLCDAGLQIFEAGNAQHALSFLNARAADVRFL